MKSTTALFWSLVFAIIAAEMSSVGSKYSSLIVCGIAWYGYFVGYQNGGCE